MAAVSQYVGDTVSGTVTWVPCFGRENPASEDLNFSHERNLCLVRHYEVFLYTICTQPPVKVITKKQIIGQPEKDDLKIIKVSFPLNRPCEEKKSEAPDSKGKNAWGKNINLPHACLQFLICLIMANLRIITTGINF